MKVCGCIKSKIYSLFLEINQSFRKTSSILQASIILAVDQYLPTEWGLGTAIQTHRDTLPKPAEQRWL